MRAQARLQGAQAAQGQIAVERAARHAEAVAPPGELLADRGVLPHDRAADDVGVAVEILRRRMHDDVGAERDRLLQRRRQKRVVDDDERADLVGEARHRGDVDDAQQRIARRFDPDDLRLAGERRGERDGVVEIDDRAAVQAALGLVDEQAIAAAVAVVRHDDQIVRAELRGHQRDRGHAGRGDDRARAALEFGQGAGEHVAGRVARARVVVGALLAEAFEAVVRRQI